MHPKSGSYEVLKRLTPVEQRCFRALLTGKELQMFEFLSTQKKFDYEKIVENFPDWDAGEIANLKARLQQSAAHYLAQKKKISHIKSYLEKKLNIAEGYLMAGLLKDATSIVARIVPKAIDADELEVANRLLHFGLRITEIDSPSASVHRDSFHGLRKTVAIRLKQEAKARIWVIEADTFRYLEPAIRKNKCLNLLQNLPNPSEWPISKARLLLVWARARCFAFVPSYSELEAEIEQGIDIGRQLPVLFHDPEASGAFAKLTYTRVYLLLKRLDFQSARIFTHAEISERLRLGVPIISDLEIKLILINLYEAGQTKKLQQFRSVLAESETILSERKWGGYDKKSIPFVAASYFLKLEQYTDSITWCKRIQLEQSSKEGKIYYTLSFSIELVALLKSHDWDGLYGASRRSLHHLKRDKDVAKFEIEFAKIMRKIARNSTKLPIMADNILSVIHEAYQLDPFGPVKKASFDCYAQVKSFLGIED